MSKPRYSPTNPVRYSQTELPNAPDPNFGYLPPNAPDPLLGAQPPGAPDWTGSYADRLPNAPDPVTGGYQPSLPGAPDPMTGDYRPQQNGLTLTQDLRPPAPTQPPDAPDPETRSPLAPSPEVLHVPPPQPPPPFDATPGDPGITHREWQHPVGVELATVRTHWS